MGFAISWLAIQGKAPEALVQELGLLPAGQMSEHSEWMFSGRVLPEGWFLLVINECDHPFVQPTLLAALSNNCEAIACSVEEHVMVCTAESWRNGVQVWRIEHDAQNSIDHISATGLLPDNYSAIEQEFAEKQKQAGGKKADTDYFFEIPLQTAGRIVGFKHDESGLEETFEIFVGSSPPAHRISGQVKKPWWKFW